MSASIMSSTGNKSTSWGQYLLGNYASAHDVAAGPSSAEHQQQQQHQEKRDSEQPQTQEVAEAAAADGGFVKRARVGGDA
jgi:hypothetical protein